MAQPYHVNWYAIITLIAIVFVLIFLIIAAVYFFNLINFRLPSTTEATFMFASSIVLSIIFFLIAVIALYEIFTYPNLIYDSVTPVSAPVSVPVSAPVSVPVYGQPQMYVAPSSYSSMHLTPIQEVGLHDQIMALGEASAQ